MRPLCASAPPDATVGARLARDAGMQRIVIVLILTVLTACAREPVAPAPAAPVSATASPAPAPPSTASVTPVPSATEQVPAIESKAKLPPVDEASKDPSFAEFRNKLSSIVRQRDAAALLAVVDPKIRVTFGESNGIEGFKRQWKPENSDSPLWTKLDDVLSLGGAFEKIPDGSERFVAPYTFAKWPESSDAFETLVAVCPGAVVYEHPDRGSKALGRLDWNILQIAPEDPLRKGQQTTEWRAVVLPGGGTAWGESRCLRSSVDYRAAFEKKNGKWTMVYFIAGD